MVIGHGETHGIKFPPTIGIGFPVKSRARLEGKPYGTMVSKRSIDECMDKE